MGHSPTISVIVPVYKVESYLRRCVDSILGQTFQDFELILVDDGSPDKCGEICDEYASVDVRVHVIHQANGGLSAARNAGLDWMFANSSSKYVTFIDSDDWVAANFLEMLYEGCRFSEIACVEPMEVSNSEMATDGSVDVVWDLLPPSIYWENRVLPMTAWGKLFKRDLWKDARFPFGRIHEDEYAIPDVLFACRQIASTTVKSYFYFRREDSIIGRNYSAKHLDAIDALIAQVCLFEHKGLQALSRKIKISLCEHYAKAILILGRKEYQTPLLAKFKDLQLPLLQYARLYKVAYPFRSRLLIPIVRVFDLLARRGVSEICRKVWQRVTKCK